MCRIGLTEEVQGHLLTFEPCLMQTSAECCSIALLWALWCRSEQRLTAEHSVSRSRSMDVGAVLTSAQLRTLRRS